LWLKIKARKVFRKAVEEALATHALMPPPNAIILPKNSCFINKIKALRRGENRPAKRQVRSLLVSPRQPLDDGAQVQWFVLRR
jgi:hypothetical protein